MLVIIYMSLQVGRIKLSQLCQMFSCHQGKDDRSQGQVVPLVQPLVPHVECCEVLYVVSSHWLYVAHGACHNSVQGVIGQKIPEEI